MDHEHEGEKYIYYRGVFQKKNDRIKRNRL